LKALQRYFPALSANKEVKFRVEVFIPCVLLGIEAFNLSHKYSRLCPPASHDNDVLWLFVLSAIVCETGFSIITGGLTAMTNSTLSTYHE